jgi:hypothetical protein
MRKKENKTTGRGKNNENSRESICCIHVNAGCRDSRILTIITCFENNTKQPVLRGDAETNKKEHTVPYHAYILNIVHNNKINNRSYQEIPRIKLSDAWPGKTTTDSAMILMMTQHFINGKRGGEGEGERLVRYRPVVGLLHGSVFTDCLLEQVLGNGDLSLRSLDGDEPLCVARLRFFDHDGGLRVVADLSYPLPPGSCNRVELHASVIFCCGSGSAPLTNGSGSNSGSDSFLQ